MTSANGKGSTTAFMLKLVLRASALPLAVMCSSRLGKNVTKTLCRCLSLRTEKWVEGLKYSLANKHISSIFVFVLYLCTTSPNLETQLFCRVKQFSPISPINAIVTPNNRPKPQFVLESKY